MGVVPSPAHAPCGRVGVVSSPPTLLLRPEALGGTDNAIAGFVPNSLKIVYQITTGEWLYLRGKRL